MKKIFAIALLIILLFYSCSWWTTEVEYRVTCNAAPYLVDITIDNGGGGISQFSDVTAPWNYSFTASSDDFVYVSAQNKQAFGIVTASIYTNGDLLETSTSSGAYVIAMAFGLVP